MIDPLSPPTAAELREAALRYIARYASTEAALRRILGNRVNKWRARQPESDGEVITGLHAAIDQVVATLVEAGLVNDKAYAEARGTSLRREGRSSRSARAKLIAKGVAASLVQETLPDDPEADLAAAVITARRRRLGPFREANRCNERDGLRDLARLMRAGFSIGTARRALEMTADEAEILIRDARR